MSRSIPFFLRHGGAIFFALVVAFLVEFPLVSFPFVAGDRYEGLNIGYFDADQHDYLARAKEVLEGNGLGNIFIQGNKSAPDPTFSSAELVLMAPVKVLHLDRTWDVPTIYNFYNVIGVFTLVLTLYALMLRLSGSRLLSIASGVFVIAGSAMIFSKELFHAAFNLYGRMPFPYLSSIVFFLFLYFLHRAVCLSSRLRDALIAGALFGLSCYLYFYGWTFTLAFVGVLFLVLLGFKRLAEARQVLIAGILGIILGSFSIVPALSFYFSAAGTQLSYFFSAGQGHAPLLSPFGMLGIAAFLVFWYVFRKTENQTALSFLGALSITGVVALNEQVVTGRYLQYGHYYWYFLVPCTILAGAYILWRFCPSRFRAYGAVAAIVVSLVSMAGGQYLAFRSTLAERLREEEYVPFMRTLHTLPAGAVLAAPDEGDRPEPLLVSILTDKDLFWAFNSLVYHVPIGRIENTLLFYLYLNKNSRVDPAAYLREQVTNPSSPYIISLYQAVEGYQSGFTSDDYHTRFKENDPTLLSFREELLKELNIKYRSLFPTDAEAREWLYAEGVRYVLWDHARSSEWDIDFLKPVTLVREENGISLFQLR